MTRWLKIAAAASFCVAARAPPARARGGPGRCAPRRPARASVSRRRRARARVRGLDLPEPLQHELEVRRLDPARVRLRLDASAPRRGRGRRGRRPPRQHGLDELRLDLDAAGLVRDEPVVRARVGPTIAARPAVRSSRVEAQVVREQVRDARLEGVELRERVLANAEQDVDAQAAAPAALRAARRSSVPGSALVLVVEEVLLELVEDEVDSLSSRRVQPAEHVGERPDLRRRVRRRVGQRAARPPSHRGRATGSPVHDETTHDERVRLAAQPLRDPGAEQRPLADAARRRTGRSAATRAGWRRSISISRSRPKKSSASSVRVVERREPLVRARRSRDARSVHAEARRARARRTRASASTYCSSGDLEHVDVAAAPELALERLRLGLHGPRAVAQRLVAPQPVQEQPQVPVGHRVAEEEEVAPPQLRARARPGRRWRPRTARGSRCSRPR